MRVAVAACVALAVVGCAGVRLSSGSAAPSAAAADPVPARFGHLGGDRSSAVEVLGEEVRPGMPTVERQVHDGMRFTLTLTPGRPGTNLVRVDTEPVGSAGTGHHHTTAEPAGRPIAVGTDADHLVPAAPRPGTDGAWARIRLPAGPSTLLVSHGPEHRLPFLVDTGTRAGAPRSASGGSGPECAAAAVGRLLAGRPTPVAACPSDRLVPTDADSLRRMVDTLAERGVGSVAVPADDSPRGRAAASVVRGEARRHGVRVVPAADRNPPARSALVVLSGWDAAARTLRRTTRVQQHRVLYGDGVWLAPWLLTPQVVDSTSGAVLPLRFDIRGSRARQYGATLGRLLPGSAPTQAGLRGWLAARGLAETGRTSLYAASRTAFMPAVPGHDHHETTVAWFPGGTITRVTGPLTGR